MPCPQEGSQRTLPVGGAAAGGEQDGRVVGDEAVALLWGASRNMMELQGARSCKRTTTSAAAPAADIANQSQSSSSPSRDVTSASPSNSPGSHYQLIGTGP